MMMVQKNTIAVVHSPDCNTNFFEIVAGVSQEHILAPYMFDNPSKNALKT